MRDSYVTKNVMCDSVDANLDETIESDHVTHCQSVTVCHCLPLSLSVPSPKDPGTPHGDEDAVLAAAYDEHKCVMFSKFDPT